MTFDQRQRLTPRALGEFAEVRLGKTPRKSDYRSTGALKIIKFRDILESGQIDWDNADKGFVADEPSALAGLREVRVGDVLVTASAHMSEHIGKKTAIVQSIPARFKEAFVVGEVLQIRPEPRVDPRWVLNYLRSRDGYKAIQDKVNGVHLIASRAREIEIPVANIDEQRRIVAEIERQFSRLDEAVANLKRVRANLKRYKASVLKAAVEGSLVSGIESEPWAMVRLTDVSQVISGLTKSPKRQALPRKLPYLRVANVYANELRLGNVEEIGVADSEIDKLLLQRGDLLVVEGNGSADQIGRVALWDGSIPNCVHQNHLIKVRFGRAVVPEWALYWLLSPKGRHEIEQVSSSTSGLRTLSAGKVGRLPLPLPPIAEQRRIVAEVQSRLESVARAQNEIGLTSQRAQVLRAAMLSSMFSNGRGD